MSRYKAGIMKPGFNPLGTQTGPVYYNSLYGWGYGSNGELGLGTITPRSSPTQVGTLTDWSSIASGGSHVLAVKTDGTLWTWGNDTDYGQSGLNSLSQRNSPVQVGSLTNWSSVSTGYQHTAAIKTDGTLWSWGYNSSGQLGQNDIVNISSPVQVGSGTTWSSVSAGYYHTAAIKTDGTLWAWGRNVNGQLGQNDVVLRSSPVQVGSLTNWSSVSAGSAHTAAIKTDGTLWTWGSNNSGELGDNAPRSSPTQVGALTNWSSVSAAYQNTIAIKTDGTLWSWGNNSFFGQLGQNNTANRSSPTQVGSLTNWLKVSAGTYHTSAIKTDGTLWTWGRNVNGQLGQNDVVDRSSPVQVGSLTTWIAIFNSNGGSNTFAMQ